FYPRTKIEKPGPRGCLIQVQTIIIATGVIAIPKQTLGRKSVLPQPFAEGNFIKRSNTFVMRALRDRKRKSASSRGVAPRDPFVQLALKAREFVAVFVAFAGMQIQTFVPTAFVKNALFGFAAEKFFAHLAAAFARKNIHFVEQFEQIGVFFERNRQVMRAPRIRNRIAFAAACGSARGFFEFEN